MNDKNILIEDILSQLEIHKEKFGLQSNEYYFNKLAVASRFDTKEVVFIKRLLQVELEIQLRKLITDYLFQKYVSTSEEAFSRELYMNIEQIKCLQRNGMHIGNHGFDHFWLGSLSKEKQMEEIDRSLLFINEIGGDINNWTMCYPYGSYNQDTLDILKNRGCKLGFTSEVDIANSTKHDQYTLPRLDTNDISKNRDAVPGALWLRG
ncbi:MAG: polysaccharide deacetylase family protein [Negativicutes bacterium]